MDFRSYLRSERLLTEQPYEQPGILPKARYSAAPQQVIFDNFYRSPKEKIYCHICGGHRHLNGITGLINSEERILFGSSCAKDFFGPEITRLCTSDLRRRTKRAYDRFLILDIANSIEPIEDWLKSYRHLVNHIDVAWTDIHLKHEQAVAGLLANLSRNSGRLVDTTHVTVGGYAQEQQSFEQHSIVTHIANPEAIQYLKQAGQRATFVDAFILAVRRVKSEPSDQIFSNLTTMYQKTLEAARIVDSVISFTNDFFQSEKLLLLAGWMEKERLIRLRHLAEITKQNLAVNLIKIMGSGIERPSTSLSDAIRATDITEKLQQRVKKTEIKRITAI